MFIQIYRQSGISILFALIFLMVGIPLQGIAHETEWPGQKLSTIFPKAEKFVQRSVILTADKRASIEKELGTKLLPEDLKPIFYIPLNDKKKPMGLVLFSDIKGPRGVIEGAVGLDMKGKVVKVAIYEHKETDAIADEKFLKQFIDMGINDTFKVGEGIEAIDGHEAASSAVALIPKKTLVMSYALFLKRKPKSDAEKNACT